MEVDLLELSTCESDSVRLDLRGKEVSVPVSVLERYPESLLAVMCRETTGAVNGAKPIAVDRDPELFESILKIYRHSGDHTVLASAPNGRSISDLERELDFYQLPPLDDLKLVLHSDWYKATGDISNLAKNMLAKLSPNRKNCFMKDRGAFLVWIMKDDLFSDFQNLKFSTGYIGVPTELDGKPTYMKNVFSLVHKALMNLGAFSSVSELEYGLSVEAGNLVVKTSKGKILLPRFRDSALKMLAEELSGFGFGLKQFIFDINNKPCPVLIVEW
ncbi:hypothetical protein BSKO_04671 [Bryopsis sp. KO-2023]|nr:hypothetical protein BSKO_04671 [Bryopsis sp. KO-2023]